MPLERRLSNNLTSLIVSIFSGRRIRDTQSGLRLVPLYLLRGISALDKIQDDNPDIQAGINIVRRALEEPLRQIANNAGQEGSVVVNKVKEFKGNKGFDAQSEEYVDMIEAGIIDAAKVPRSALQNAGSIAALFLTTEAVIADAPEDGGGMPGGMPDMDF